MAPAAQAAPSLGMGGGGQAAPSVAAKVIPTTAAARQSQAQLRLPELREELHIFPGAPHRDGSPSWVIQDPVLNRFYRIGWLEFELLTRWSDGAPEAVVQAVQDETPLAAEMVDLQALILFLADNQLLRAIGRPQVERLEARHRQQTGTHWAMRLVHGYLFFRVPLLRPQRWLDASRPLLERLHLPLLMLPVLLCAVLGIYLVSRQWDVFTHTLVDQLTVGGLMGFAFALAIAKSLHECGHALVATRHGVRVGHMGVAFLVMTPMLYTDTGESWRLTDPRKRLAIASAGIVTELSLAAVSTLAWAVWPDGAMRNGFFFLATASWLATLAINASPFMRFDGYFIVSDMLDMPNLHERSTALAQVWLRRVLLGLQGPWPESFPTAKRRALIAFALGSWVYRLLLFIGIALLVYHFFFKALGIVAMAIELYWFVARPVAKEIGVWNKRRADISRARRGGLALLGLAAIALLATPLAGSVHGEGWVHAREQQRIYAPFAAQLVGVPRQRVFKAGEPIFTLDSPTLGIAQHKAVDQASTRDVQLSGLLGLPDGESQRQVLLSQRAVHEAEAKSNLVELSRLVLRAPFDGELKDLDPGFEQGVWVQAQEPLGVLTAGGGEMAEVYIAEAELGRVKPGQSATVWLAADPRLRSEGEVQSIDVARAAALPEALLDGKHGGPIATTSSASSSGAAEHAPRDALYRVRIRMARPIAQHASLVKVHIDGTRESIASALTRRVVAVLIREGNF